MPYWRTSSRHNTCAPDSAGYCRTVFSNSVCKPAVFGAHGLEMRTTPISPALVTSAFSLRKLSKARCHTNDTGLFRLSKTKSLKLCRSQSVLKPSRRQRAKDSNKGAGFELWRRRRRFGHCQIRGEGHRSPACLGSKACRRAIARMKAGAGVAEHCQLDYDHLDFAWWCNGSTSF